MREIASIGDSSKYGNVWFRPRRSGDDERVVRQDPTIVKHLKLVLSVPWHYDATEGTPKTERR